ncbi:MAG: PEP-CTERM sorting domain-containing protein [Rubrivivax sp.]|nr:PEP-CTERM sorting domain-containing protein [Rubrivivax sp.]
MSASAAAGESKYEDVNGAWDIADGSFRASEFEKATEDHPDSFFTAIGSTSSLDGKYGMTLEASGRQDMITGDPSPTDVPEPGTLALLGVAAVGLVATRRRFA